MAEGFLSTYERRYANDPDYIGETLAVAVLEQAARRMSEQGISQADLAARIGVPLITVQRLFDGDPRLVTLRALAQLAVALGMTARVELT